MIQGVHVYSDNGETAWLPLSDPYGTGLAVLNITGLGPVKTDLRITNYGAQSGGYYNGSRVGTRDIVFTLKPLGPDIEYVRRWAYKLLDVEEHVSMVFVTDYGDRRIDGYVESFEADIFSKNELFTVSVICPRPEFTDGDGVVLTSSSADTMNATFEFPFESRWLMDDIEFGTPRNYAENIVHYSGDVPVGCEIHVDILSDPGKTVTIFGPRGTQVTVENVNNTIKKGGRLVLNTVIGKREAYFVKDGKKVDLAWTLWNQSNWPVLYPGYNTFAVQTEETLEVRLTCYYQNMYRGI